MGTWVGYAVRGLWLSRDSRNSSLSSTLDLHHRHRRRRRLHRPTPLEREQEEIKYTVAETDAEGALKAGPVKDERFKELKAKEEKVTKDFQKHLDAGMAQVIDDLGSLERW